MSCCEFCCYPLSCDNFWEKQEELIHLDKLKDNSGNLLYPDSNFTYCRNCWNNRKELNFKCDKCKIGYQAYMCDNHNKSIENSDDDMRVCYDCRCNKKKSYKCNYCPDSNYTINYLYDCILQAPSISLDTVESETRLKYEILKKMIRHGYGNFVVLCLCVKNNIFEMKILEINTKDLKNVKGYLKWEYDGPKFSYFFSDY